MRAPSTHGKERAIAWQSDFAGFRARTTAGSWNLPRDRVADDLQTMLAEPDQVNEGMFGFSGIAACLRS